MSTGPAVERSDGTDHVARRRPRARATSGATSGGRRAPRAPRALVASVVLGAVVVAVGCGDTEFSSAPPDAGHVDVGALPRPPADDLPRPPVAVVSPTEPPDVAPTTDPTTDPTTGPTTDPTPVPPGEDPGEEPGDDPADGVCLAWSQIWTTHQTLAMAAEFGRLTDVQIARLEVVAAALVTDAVERLDAALEAQGGAIRAERPLIRQELLGRFEARARAALVALDELSTSDDVPFLLAQVWLDGLRDLDPDATVPELADLGPEFGPIVDRAAAAFRADAPRWDDDPALDVGVVAVPATDELVRRACADLGVPPVGDAF